MMTNGSASPSTQYQEVTSYVCVLMLMAVLVVQAHTYLCMYFSWKVRMTIICSGLLSMMWHTGYSTGKEMRIMSSTLLTSRMLLWNAKKGLHLSNGLRDGVSISSFATLPYLMVILTILSTFTMIVCVCKCSKLSHPNKHLLYGCFVYEYN